MFSSLAKVVSSALDPVSIDVGQLTVAGQDDGGILALQLTIR